MDVDTSSLRAVLRLLAAGGLAIVGLSSLNKNGKTANLVLRKHFFGFVAQSTKSGFATADADCRHTVKSDLLCIFHPSLFHDGTTSIKRVAKPKEASESCLVPLECTVPQKVACERRRHKAHNPCVTISMSAKNECNQ